ncbi:MAG: lysylphosphatidylglycerol synthase transmembrane domain-containing protein [bacterium]|nr:lysylphosphatidylglycerol synthase transmembrane domain-containing protein [bacterium]
MFEQLKRKLLISVGLGALVFLGLSIYSDLDRLAEAFRAFELIFVPLALFLALVNYGVRFVRWQMYLSWLKIPLAKGDSLIVFLAGLVLSVTPGKAGELLKAYFIRHRLGIPVRRSAPAVVMERLADFIALIFLSLAGVFSFEQGVLPFWVVTGLTAGMLLFLGWSKGMGWCIEWFGRLPVVGRFAPSFRDAYEGMRVLITPLHLFGGVVLGIAAWFAECLGFYYVIHGFGGQVGVAAATFIYSFATLFGALTLLPGGLGPTEGSMSGLLVHRGMPLANAVGATFIIRVCTLWFAVALGALVFILGRNRLDWAEDVEPEFAKGVQIEADGIVEKET